MKHHSIRRENKVQIRNISSFSKKIICGLCVICGSSLTVAAPQETVPVQPALLDVASVYNGAFAVKRDFGSISGTSQVLSGMRNYGDYMVKSDGSRSDILIELAESATIERLRLIGPVNDNLAPSRIEVSLSDSPAGPFKVIAVTDLEPVSNKDLYSNTFDVRLPVAEKRSGRFMRFRMSGSLKGDPSKNAYAMASLQAFGTFKKEPALPDAAGVYHFQGDFGNDASGGFYLSLKQDGDWVEGCAVATSSSRRPIKPERILNLVSGGVQNGVLHLERSDASGNNKKSGILSFTTDGKFAHSAFFREGNDPSVFGSVERAVGERIATAPVACTTAKQPAQTTQDIWEEALEKKGVIQLYGVNFDLDSDVLRKESYAVLDKVVVIAKEKPDWIFEIAGHTDSSGFAAHNRDLSLRRANSVVRYLAAAGVKTARLRAKGYGADKPLMSNDTAAGMAQNRRVELIRLKD